MSASLVGSEMCIRDRALLKASSSDMDEDLPANPAGRAAEDLSDAIAQLKLIVDAKSEPGDIKE
eukprot:1967376-Alexandrium_andersonii.AAC.1